MSRNKCCQTMLISQRVGFMLLLTHLQWTRCDVNNTTADITTSSTTVPTSITSVVTSSTVTSTVTEYDTQSNSTILPETPLSPTTQQLDYSTEDTNQSFTSDNRMSSASEIPTTSSLLAISDSYAHTTYTKSSEAASNSFTTTTYDVSFSTTVIPSDTTNDIQTTSVTAPLHNTTLAMSLTTSNNSKPVLTTSEQTTRLTSSSAETRQPTQENHSNGAVIFGAIVGAVLGCALIGLVGYFMCKKKKSEGFSHQRLYDDTGNDPVLRLDNTPESYGDNFADMSYYNPTMDNEMTAQNSDVPPYDAIPMNNMTLSPHLP